MNEIAGRTDGSEPGGTACFNAGMDYGKII